jgi:hypothetical protein
MGKTIVAKVYGCSLAYMQRMLSLPIMAMETIMAKTKTKTKTKTKAANDNGEHLFAFEQQATLLIEGERAGLVNYYFVFNDEEAWMARWPAFAEQYRQQRLKQAMAAIQPDVA